MSELPLRIERLPPMHVAAVRAVSATPEKDAWQKLRAWAEPRGLLRQPRLHPVFGFNNPAPAADDTAYGYEFWIRVDPHAHATGDVELKVFSGGLYAVTTCRLMRDPAGAIGEVWQRLWDQVQAGPYRWRRMHELEHPHDPLATDTAMVLDLYLPIEPCETPPEPPPTDPPTDPDAA